MYNSNAPDRACFEDKRRGYDCKCGEGMSDATDGIAVAVGGSGCINHNECGEDATNVCGPKATGHYCNDLDVLDKLVGPDTATVKAIRTNENAADGYKMYECQCQHEGVFFTLTENVNGDDLFECVNVDYCQVQLDAGNPNPCGTNEHITCVDIENQTNFDEYVNDLPSTARTRAFDCECAAGYKFEDNDGVFTCADVDECTETAEDGSALHNCVGEHTKCTNTIGSFVCECDTTKHEAGQGVMNDDVTECLDFESCTGNNECYHSEHNAHGVCTEGTFEPPTCSCASGWEQVPAPEGHDDNTSWPAEPQSSTQVGTCNQNIDECTVNPNICDGRPNTTCKDNAGSYDCECNAGYSRDGNFVADDVTSVAADGEGCYNVDECSDPAYNDCDDTTAICNDDEGTYHCTCKLSTVNAAGGTSVIMQFPDPTDDKTACVDIDECAFTDEADNPCGAGLICDNVVCPDGDNGACLEGYTCSCPEGTSMILQITDTGYEQVCRNTNECDVFESNSCNPNAGVICTDGDVLQGEDPFTCSCGVGLEPSGTGTDMVCVNKLECDDPSQNSCGTGAAASCVDVDAEATVYNETVSGVQILAAWGLQGDAVGYTCGCNGCDATSGADASSYYTLTEENKCIFNDVCATQSTCDSTSTDCVAALGAGMEDCFTGAAFTCECKSGFDSKATVDGVETCQDINECLTTTHGCENTPLKYFKNADATTAEVLPAECINNVGGFSCGCGTVGFSQATEDDECFAINDCAANPCGALADCTDLDNIETGGSGLRGYVNLENTFACGCQAGYEPSACANDDVDGACTQEIVDNGCQNIDECTVRQNNGESIASICTNVETDEEQAGASECVDSEGSYTCKCATGYEKAGSIAEGNFSCNDFQECVQKQNSLMRALGVKIECGAHSTCREGFDGVHTYCECHAGYDYLVEDGVTSERDCVDIDECAEGYVNDCKANTECVNRIDGTHACNCLPGYESADAKLNDCTNIDECTSVTNPHNCDANAQCSDTKGAFTCFCNQYWEGDGYTCTDIDECVPDKNGDKQHNCDDPHEVCSDRDNGFDCVCEEGYEREDCGAVNSAECDCVSKSECATLTCGDENASCQELEGINTGYGIDGTPNGGVGFSCECNEFYTMNSDTNTCRNYNECGDDIDDPTHNCHGFATCTDVDGAGFTCKCDDGYVGDGYVGDANTGCSDVNECTNVDGSGKTLAVNCGNMYDGTNTYSVQMCTELSTAEGRYSCACTSDLVIESSTDGTKETCVDVNECTTELESRKHSCPENSTCQNRDHVFDGVPDTNGYNGYSCACNEGFTAKNGDGTLATDADLRDSATCVDDNECLICEGGAACTAEEGSVFRCGSYLNNVCNNLDGGFECLCQDGFEKVDGVCLNVDECRAGTDTCFDATVEAQTEGFMSEICTDAEILVAGDAKFTCACPENSSITADGCEDYNECNDVCNQGEAVETCINKHFINDGVTHTCTCATGYRKEITDPSTTPATVDDNKCVDIDECQSNPCTGNGAKCTNTAGSYVCECELAGTQLVGDVCENIDECTAGTDDCAHVCNDNAPAAEGDAFFTCSCDDGYALESDGKSCGDIDECAGDNECVANASCDNTIGSYECTCNQYWNADGSDARVECINNDECADDTTLCGGSEVPENLYGECINLTDGSYECSCMTGFTFEGDVCVDIDECETGDHVCQPSAVCVNQHMGTDGQKYTCDCDPGTMPEILYNRQELARTSGVIITCKDIDECEIGADRCHIKAHCIDTAYDHSDNCLLDTDVDCTPGYDCECNVGYKADPNGEHADSRDKGPVCIDVNECTETDENGNALHNCNEHAKCHNNEGSFTCSCKKGWTGTAYGQGSCTDYE